MTTIPVLNATGGIVNVELPLVPGRSAAATSRPVALSTEDAAALALLATAAQIGEVQTSPTANTLLDRLKTIATTLAGSLTVAAHAVTNAGTFAVQAAVAPGASETKVTAATIGTGGVGYLGWLSTIAQALAGTLTVASHAVTNAGTFAVQATLTAGALILGKVGIDQTTVGTTDSVSVKSQAFAAAVSTTRPANTTAYAINDVVGATAAAWTFGSMGPSGKEIVITSAALEVDDTAVISGETSYRLYFYNVTPPSALADNAAFDLPSGDRASYLGYVDLGAPADLGSTLYVESNLINKQLTLSGTSLFGYLVTNGAFTPTSARVYKITLHSVAV